MLAEPSDRSYKPSWSVNDMPSEGGSQPVSDRQELLPLEYPVRKAVKLYASRLEALGLIVVGNLLLAALVWIIHIHRYGGLLFAFVCVPAVFIIILRPRQLVHAVVIVISIIWGQDE